MGNCGFSITNQFEHKKSPTTHQGKIEGGKGTYTIQYMFQRTV